MNPLRYLLPTFLSLALFTSCEKVIDVEVTDADKKYVIEAVLTNEAGGCVVKISQTKALHETNSFAGVAGAVVRITEEGGTAETLTAVSPGIYRGSLVGAPGRRYTLQVSVGGKGFAATSHMPQAVPLDSLYTSAMEMMGEKEYYTNVVFTDPAEKGNAYRFVQYINGTKTRDVFVLSDELSNGRQNTTTLFSHNAQQEDLEKGDEIRVELLSIDPPVYHYWFSLWQGATGEGNSASPANPVSNISGGALGYFSAHSVAAKTTVVQ